MAAKTIPITIQVARETGTKDGRMGYPPPDYDGSSGQISEFEKDLSNVASRQIDELVTAWQTSTNRALLEIKNLVPDLLMAVQECRLSLKQHQQMYGGDARPETKHKSTKWMIAGLAFLFVVEIAVNASTFRILREANVFTYILGIGLSVLSPLAGFLTGRVIKARDRTLYESALAAALFVVAVALVWVVAEGREIAIRQRGLDPEVVNEAFWIFLLMNILLFLIAIWHGYNTWYKFPHLQKRVEEFRTRKRQFTNRWGRLNEALITCLGEVRQLVAEAHSRQSDYQQANRDARFDTGKSAGLPIYFTNNTRLPIQYPVVVAEVLDSKEPTSAFHRQLLANEQFAFLKEAEDAIAAIDNIIEGKGA